MNGSNVRVSGAGTESVNGLYLFSGASTSDGGRIGWWSNDWILAFYDPAWYMVSRLSGATAYEAPPVDGGDGHSVFDDVYAQFPDGPWNVYKGNGELPGVSPAPEVQLMKEVTATSSRRSDAVGDSKRDWHDESANKRKWDEDDWHGGWEEDDKQGRSKNRRKWDNDDWKEKDWSKSSWDEKDWSKSSWDEASSMKESVKRDKHGFFPDERCYDSAESYGMTFPRSIPPTKWSLEKDVAHTDPMEAKVVDYVYKGADNFAMRLLANGKFIVFDAARSMNEHYLVSEMLKRVRDKSRANLNLDKIMENVAQRFGLKKDSGEQKRAVWNNVADELCKALLRLQEEDQVGTRIRELEEENERLRGSRSKQPDELPTESADWTKFERGTKRKVFENLAVAGTFKKQVDAALTKLALPGDKMKQVQNLAKEVQDLLKKGSRLERQTKQTRIETLLVEWGIAPTAVVKKPDFAGMAKLLAAAVVVAE